VAAARKEQQQQGADGSPTHTDGTEGEGHDRNYIGLPDGQMALVDAAVSAAKPGTRIIVVLFNGGGLAIETMMANPSIGAIVEAFYPGVAGATALAATLFGKSNRFSKLPYTLLGSGFTTESNFLDMNMTDGVGRTYKYYTGVNTIAPFGFGLSYTSFSLSFANVGVTSSSGASNSSRAGNRRPNIEAVVSGRELDRVQFGQRSQGQLRGDDVILTSSDVIVTNTGNVAGDEVVFLFHNASAAHSAYGNSTDPLAKKQLVAFQRVQLAPGQSTTVHFNISLRMLSTVAADGNRHVLAGDHGLIVSRGHGSVLSATVSLILGNGDSAVSVAGTW